MKGLTADQIYPSVMFQINQVQDPSERQKLETMILGAVESKLRRKARISAQLDKIPRYQYNQKTIKKIK
ncbi:hypothetical protein [Chryseobacterium potabilaquae]|uniref:Uncharacterized protein n=1 Tax=Chryseobacterium potabilaquae TaxID=2675057 RepID=A0A6N4X707_9FLAO|nr:hypothetical protein [Chryseobacterium potabilaquae]CAA7196848.1 hypothetical protein CHRY9293_02914 [Chryseobacterium potabilaquae]